MELLTLPFKLVLMLGMALQGDFKTLHDPLVSKLVLEASTVNGECLDKASALARLMNSYGDYKDHARVVVGTYSKRHELMTGDKTLHAWVELDNKWILDPTFPDIEKGSGKLRLWTKKNSNFHGYYLPSKAVETVGGINIIGKRQK